MGNQWNPGIEYRGDRYIAQAGQNISESLQKALAKYDEDKRQRDYNTGIFEAIKDPAIAKGYVPVDALNRWNTSMKTDEQSGILAGIMRRASEDQQKQQESRLASAAAAQEAEAKARANLLWAQGAHEWAGEGADGPTELTPEEVANAEEAGGKMVRVGPHSFRFVKDPSNPLNQMGPTPIDKYGRKIDPNTDPKTEVAGLLQTNGSVRYFPKPSLMQELIDAGMINGEKSKTNTTPTPAAATPSATSVPAGKVRVKGPDGAVGFIPADQLQQALARGATLAQ